MRIGGLGGAPGHRLGEVVLTGPCGEHQAGRVVVDRLVGQQAFDEQVVQAAFGLEHRYPRVIAVSRTVVVGTNGGIHAPIHRNVG